MGEMHVTNRPDVTPTKTTTVLFPLTTGAGKIKDIMLYLRSIRQTAKSHVMHRIQIAVENLSITGRSYDRSR